MLIAKGEDKDQWWDQMLDQDGSVQGLPDNVLTPEEKELFLTFPENFRWIRPMISEI
jgi:hypothetical protein